MGKAARSRAWLREESIPRCRNPPVSTFRIENRARSASWRFPGFRSGSAAQPIARFGWPTLRLAEEACRLQRRGRTWHLVPLGPKGSILVQDRPIEGPYPLPFDVPFRIGSICFTLRQNRSSDPDWEMYRTLSSAQHRRPMSINPLPVSLPAVERCIASIAPPRSQRDIVHESSIPLAPRIESPLERSTSPRPVNPWEARWKAAGARLQAERKQPLPPGRPHPSPPADRYQSVPLKEPSVPLSRKAEPAVSPSRSREFSTHPLTPAAAPGYPVPPSISARSRLDANLPIKAPRSPRSLPSPQ